MIAHLVAGLILVNNFSASAQPAPRLSYSRSHDTGFGKMEGGCFGCLTLTGAPDKFAHEDLPPGWKVVLKPYADIPVICDGAGVTTDLGCEVPAMHIVFLPDPDTTPFDADCMSANRKHAIAHLWGWSGDHRGGKLVYLCHPKK